MKICVLNGRQHLSLIEIEKPKINNDEILLKVACCGVCRTDVKAFFTGQKDLHMPRVLGHEIVGTIDEMGENVSNYHIGQRVVLHPGIFCGKCEVCLNNLDQLCSEMKIFGFHLDGGFSELCVIPSTGVKNGILLPIPQKMDFKTAVLAEPLACAINMMEAINQQPKNLLIFGGGVLGTLTVLLWRRHGVSSIIVVEPNEYKRDKLSELNIASYSNVSEFEGSFDAAICCCPYIDAYKNAIQRLNPRGLLGFFSGLNGDEAIDNNLLNLIHYKELRVFGSYGCALEHTKYAVRLLDEGLTQDITINFMDLDEVKNYICHFEHINNNFNAIKF